MAKIVAYPFVMLWRLILLLKRLTVAFLEGSRLPSSMRNCPEYVPVALYGLSSLAGVPTGVTSGGLRTTCVIVAFVSFLAATVLVYARYVQLRSFEKFKTLAVERVRQEHRDDVERLLGKHLVNILNVIGEVLLEEDDAKRRELASNARKTAVCMAANLVGKSAGNGTRANLFRLNDTKTEMKLEPGAFYGRGDRSTRVFSLNDDSFDIFKNTMRNDITFVESIPDEVIQQEHLAGRYRTYITHPVSIVGGSTDEPFHIYGVLTVDCPDAGDLDPKIDVAKVAVFSTLIAATYEC